MKRLTERVDMGWDEYNSICFINPEDPEGAYNLDDIVRHGKDDVKLAIAERLVAYEDTGLMPGEVVEIRAFIDSQLEKLTKENAAILAALDRGRAEREAAVRWVKKMTRKLYAGVACLHKTTDGKCVLHSDAECQEPCVEGPCDDWCSPRQEEER